MTDRAVDDTNDDLIDRARVLAQEVHAGQERKESGVGYFEGHVELVADLVRSAGGSDVQIAAAYLHDAAEDSGGQARLDQIRAYLAVVTIEEKVMELKARKAQLLPTSSKAIAVSAAP